jgi:hypothetical protein
MTARVALVPATKPATAAVAVAAVRAAVAAARAGTALSGHSKASSSGLIWYYPFLFRCFLPFYFAHVVLSR